jgi:DHA2 family multidrug resistance protein
MAEMSRGEKFFAIFILALGNFMVMLDMTIANVSIPSIAGNLGASINQGTWVITSYTVSEAIILPMTGWLTRRVGTVRLLVISVLAFTAASAACGLSPTFGSLVFFRVLQGIAGAPVMPLTQSLLYGVRIGESSALSVGISAITSLLAPAAGPVLGGAIVDNFHWSWIFLINVPVGLICASSIWRLFRNAETPRQGGPMDFVGMGLLVVAVGSLQILLDKGKDLDWFGSPLITTLAVVAAIGFVLLLIWEFGEKHPVIDLHLFSNRNYVTYVSMFTLVFSVYFGGVVLVPLWLQTTLGYSARWAGFAVAPIGIFAIVLVPVVASQIGRMDARVLITIGLVVLFISFLMRAFMPPDADFGAAALPQLVQGATIAFFFMPLTMLTLASVPPHETASAASMMNFLRTMMASFATSIITTFWDSQTARHHADLVASITPFDAHASDVLGRYAELGLDPVQSSVLLDRLVNSQSATMALNDYFAFSALLVAALAVFVWSTKRVQVRTSVEFH